MILHVTWQQLWKHSPYNTPSGLHMRCRNIHILRSPLLMRAGEGAAEEGPRQGDVRQRCPGNTAGEEE
jgi:hypothetical protein